MNRKKSPRIARRKIRVLESELQMLQRYKNDISVLFDEYQVEFSKDMIQLEKIFQEKQSPLSEDCADNPESELIKPNLKSENHSQKDNRANEEKKETSSDDSLSTETKKNDAPSWAKKLYKKIALLTHPDKISNDHRKEKLNMIFLECSDAMDEGDFTKLLGFALELDIPITEEDVDLLPLLSERIKDIRDEIHSVEKSAAWLWGEGLGVSEIRLRIAFAYLSQKKIPVDRAALEQALEDLEKDQLED